MDTDDLFHERADTEQPPKRQAGRMMVSACKVKLSGKRIGRGTNSEYDVGMGQETEAYAQTEIDRAGRQT